MRLNIQLKMGLIFLGLLLIICLIGPHLPFIDKELTKTGAVMSEDEGKLLIPPFKPSSEFWFGSDRKGVDLLSRIVVGAKDMLILILSITILRYLIAIPLGLFAFYSKAVNGLLQFLNLALSFVPAIFMIILFINMPYLIFSQHRITWVIFIIAFLDVGRVAELVKQQVMIISQKPYIEAAITLGTRPVQLMRNYYLPVLYPELLINVILDLGRTTFIIGQLGIIGIYVSHQVQAINAMNIPVYELQNTSNAWPLLFETLMHDIFSAPWIPIFTGLAITLVILGFFTLAEGVRRHFRKGVEYF